MRGLALLIVAASIGACTTTPRVHVDPDGSLSFSNQPLGYIADEISQRTRVRIEVHGAKLAQRLYTMRVRPDVPAFLTLIRHDPEMVIDVVETGNAVILREKKPR